jgi:DNA-binding CsgD family transcriptional regulator
MLPAVRRGRPAYPDVLTPREWEVLALIREGLTNLQIAERLGISESGARFHVSEILSKLGVDSRQDAVNWRGVPRRVPILAGLMARLSGTLARIAVGLLATAVLALGALALGVVVLDRRGGQADMLAGQQETSEQARAEMLQLAEEATAAARAAAPNSVLYLIWYAGGGGLYTFVFNEPGASREIAMVGPSNETCTPRWELSTNDVPNRPAVPLPLDVKSLQKTPTAVLQAMDSARPAAATSGGGGIVGVSTDPATGELRWTATGAVSSGRGPENPRPIQCELKDAAPISTITCNP